MFEVLARNETISKELGEKKARIARFRNVIDMAQLKQKV